MLLRRAIVMIAQKAPLLDLLRLSIALSVHQVLLTRVRVNKFVKIVIMVISVMVVEHWNAPSVPLVNFRIKEDKVAVCHVLRVRLVLLRVNQYARYVQLVHI